jgi:hypothetical protein
VPSEASPRRDLAYLIEHGEWHVWGMTLAVERPDIARAVSNFQADAKHDASSVVTRWLREESFDERAAVTHVLEVPQSGDADPDIAAFVALASAEAVVDQRTSSSYRSSTNRMPATYVAYIGRHMNYPGAGKLALAWAGDVAREVGLRQANLLFVLHAADEATAHMWSKRYGFKETAEGETFRLWAPFPRS